MNQKQRIVLFLSVIAIAVCGLYGPTIWRQSCGGVQQHEVHGYAWLPKTSSFPEFMAYYTCPELGTPSLSESVDFEKLVAEWGTISLSCVGLLLALRSSTPR
jgi:hypothetical protein